jgi:hypothetical protein
LFFSVFDAEPGLFRGDHFLRGGLELFFWGQQFGLSGCIFGMSGCLFYRSDRQAIAAGVHEHRGFERRLEVKIFEWPRSRCDSRTAMLLAC